MMKNKRRSQRRFDEKRVQEKRARDAKMLGIPLTDRNLGRLKNNHFGCGCALCKGWKHGLDDAYPHGQKKKLKPDGS